MLKELPEDTAHTPNILPGMSCQGQIFQEIGMKMKTPNYFLISCQFFQKGCGSRVIPLVLQANTRSSSHLTGHLWAVSFFLLNLTALSNKSFWNISVWIWSHHRPEVSAAHEQLLHPGQGEPPAWGCSPASSAQHQLQEPGMSQREAGNAAGTSWLQEGSRDLPGMGRHLRQPAWLQLCISSGTRSWCS